MCSHIRDALTTRTEIPTWSTYPRRMTGDYMVLRLCATCVDTGRLPVPARSVDLDDHDLEQLRTEAICEACFAARSSAP